MKKLSPTMQQVPLNMVGSTVFGRYPKISIEQTFNMIISDNWLVPYAGYKNVAVIAATGQGRAIYKSTNYNRMFFVVEDKLYAADPGLAIAEIATIETFSGDVFIAENDAGQIAVCDKKNIYVLNYGTNTFSIASVDFLPGYIAFQDGYFISVDLRTSQWRLSNPNDGTTWPDAAPNVGSFQTKPDKPLAVVRFPGKGNMLLVFGSTVTESWYDVGSQLFPYEKNTFFNIDFGCLNPATIAAEDSVVIWLGGNEQSGPTIMFTDGSGVQQLSNDGINFRLAQLTNPSNSYGFIFRQDGHLIYQITFPDDNLTLAYDFNTKKFFTLTDEYMSYHIAKRIVFFNNSYYFVSFSDGNLYQMSSQFTTYDGAEIPRIRICKNTRMPDASWFVVNSLTFTLEQGESADIARIDLSVSIDGGQSFGSSLGYDLNPIAIRKNKLNFWGLGAANDFVPQFRFWGQGRFVLTDGLVNVYQ